MGKDIKGKELEKGISQRSDLLYVGRFTDRYGKRRQKVFSKLQECRQWLADTQFEDEQGDCAFDKEIRVKDWYLYWIDLKEKTVRPNTHRNYRERYLRNIDPVIGKMKLKDVKPFACQQIMNRMAEQGYTSSTIYQARIALFNMFDYAVQNDVIIKNPCNKTVKANIGKEVSKKEALTIEQQKKFLYGIKGNAYENQYAFLLQTGLRTGEMVGLRWSDIDFEKRILHVNQTMEYRYNVGKWRVGPPKGQAGYRSVPLTDEAIETLRRQKMKNAMCKVLPIEWKDYIFLCRKGTPVKNSTYDTMLQKMCDRICIPRFSMHVLRHTFATRCIEAGMKPKTLQTILGHSNIGITMNRYVHTTEDEKRREMMSISESLKVI